MLVLSRKAGEHLQIGPDIYVTILEISKDRIRVGIEAPEDVKIIRTELKPLIDVPTHSPELSMPVVFDHSVGL